MSRRTLAIFAVLALAFAILTGLAVRYGILSAKPQTAAVGGPFQLVDQTGRNVDERLLKGKWSAVFFGFTYCPDVCPTTLFALGQAEKRLGAQANDFQTVFISVDPGRDTPQQVATYISNPGFPTRTWGLTGAPEQVTQAAKAYRVFYQKRGEGDAYSVDHSTIVYLMNPKGQLACVIPHNAPPEVFAAKVQSAMKGGSNGQAC